MARVLVVARSAIERTGLETLLAAAGHVVVPGGAATPADATRRASTTSPQVVLWVLDSESDGAQLALAPDLEASAPAIVVLGDGGRAGWALGAVRAGARAALPRTASAEAIGAAVDAVAAGLLVLPSDAIDPAGRAFTVTGAPVLDVPTLTAREAQILALLADGLGNKVIGARLGISRHTVKTHVAALFQKLGVSTRAEAVAAGARMGAILL